MKITSFNPLIVTKDAENVIKLFEEMAYKRIKQNNMLLYKKFYTAT